MKSTTVSIKKIQQNPDNPRIIKDDKFKLLVKSIKEFPKMLELRPIVVDRDYVVLGGNMRLKACQEAGLNEVPIIIADELTDKQQREFIIKDNVGYGEWDWDVLANEWDELELNDWGLEVWKSPTEIDYSILDDSEELNDAITNMTDNVKKAIQIEFELEHYEEAFELVKFWREQKLYIGGFLVEKLKEEKDKL